MVHAQDAEFDKGHADTVEVFVDDVDLPSGEMLGFKTSIKLFSSLGTSL